METHFASLEEAHSAISRERVMRDLRTLARDTEDLLKVTAGDLGDKANEIRQNVSTALSRAKVSYAEIQEQAITSAKSAARKADTQIRAHPYQWLGVAFGAGLLVGVLLARK